MGDAAATAQSGRRPARARRDQPPGTGIASRWSPSCSRRRERPWRRTRTIYRRRRGHRSTSKPTSRARSSASSTRSICTGSRFGYAAVVFGTCRGRCHRRPGACGRRFARTSPGVQVLDCVPSGSSDGVRAGIVPRDWGAVLFYLLLVGSSSPGVTTASFTLALLIMVVLGGTGTPGAAHRGALHLPR